MRLLCLSLLYYSLSSFSQTILIDPGHGGSELGVIGLWKGEDIFEKNLSLLYAQELKSVLSQKGFMVYLTRSFDRELSLSDRAMMNDVVKADLFLSIHLNSSRDIDHQGFEVFYLHNQENAASRKMAAVENKNIEKDESKKMNDILSDLIADRSSGDSKKFANFIYDEVSKTTALKYKVKDRGLKPGLLYVLALAKRPSALIELGFMSNYQELGRLKNPQFIQEMAESISQGVQNYWLNYSK